MRESLQAEKTGREEWDLGMRRSLPEEALEIMGVDVEPIARSHGIEL